MKLVQWKFTFEDKILSEPFNFYGMYLNITEEEREQSLESVAVI